MSKAFLSPVGPAKLRTLYIRVKPAPSTLSERRAVLGALSQHGKIEMFKQLYDASSFISIASTQTIAASIVRRSPLQFDVLAKNSFDPRVPDSIRPPTPAEKTQTFSLPSLSGILPGTGINSLGGPKKTKGSKKSKKQKKTAAAAAAAAEATSPDNKSSQPQPQPQLQGQLPLPLAPSASKLPTPAERDPTSLVTKTFTVEAFSETEYPHKDHIRMSPLYGPWPLEHDLDLDRSSPSKQNMTLTRAALRASVPKDMAYDGLHDWESAGQDAMDLAEAAAAEEALAKDSETLARTWRAFWRGRTDRGEKLQYDLGTEGDLSEKYAHIMRRRMRQENKKRVLGMLS
ncbi:hypothetical protein B0T20DRAFT_26893 [Sordaria brevicollis]|uniref:Uncharacterized protein n=1 Tax=Sordaria brevicollis TaxID=83679 RepID=A0AAE0PPE5_SORBR|nr:hypothetical protein B0T20DRAFT_26893 [Sordaria brevicollis]